MKISQCFLTLFKTKLQLLNARAKGKARAKYARGINLIEIMVVLMIIGLIGGFVFTSLMPVAEGAKVTAAKVQMSNLAGALNQYKLENNFYPTTQQGLQALVQMPQTEPLPKNYRNLGYLSAKKVPLDPWGNPYIYEYPDPDNPDRFLLKSLGSDGKEGGDGNAKDIKSDD